MDAPPLPSLVIPAYRPAARLVPLVKELLADGYPRIVVVDDGSGPAHRAVFERVARLPRVEVLTHLVNLGKGCALKTGLNHLFARDPACAGAVTVDSDGQHLPADVRRVAAALVRHPEQLCLGSRSFDGAVPWKSRIGNTLSRWILWILSGQRLRDTQTGLRGIPRSFAASLLAVRSARYDFEQEMIVLAAREERALLQVPITTVYRDDNRGSHFDPLRDSLRVYWVFFRVLLRALRPTGVDYAVFAACFAGGLPLFASFAAGRAASRLPLLWWRRPPLRDAAVWLAYAIGGMLLTYAATRAWLDRGVLGVYAAKAAAEALLLLVLFGQRRIAGLLGQRNAVVWEEAEAAPAGREAPRARRPV